MPHTPSCPPLPNVLLQGLCVCACTFTVCELSRRRSPNTYLWHDINRSHLHCGVTNDCFRKETKLGAVGDACGAVPNLQDGRCQAHTLPTWRLDKINNMSSRQYSISSYFYAFGEGTSHICPDENHSSFKGTSFDCCRMPRMGTCTWSATQACDRG